MALWLSHKQYMSGVIWNSVLAIVFLLDKCFTSIINLRQLPKIWYENWLTIQFVPSQRHNTMVRRQIWFYTDVEEHNEHLAALIVSNRVSPLNAHWVKSIFFLQCSTCERERERHTVHNRASIVMGITQKVLMVAIVQRKLFFWWATDIVRKDIQ